MPKFVIEREIPAIGSATPEQLRAASQTSCGALRTSVPRFSGYIAMSQKIRSTVFISHPTKLQSENTPVWGAFPLTGSRTCPRRLIRRRPSKQSKKNKFCQLSSFRLGLRLIRWRPARVAKC